MTGLSCPECGSTLLRVQQTVPGTQGVVRRRLCANGHRFNTEELPCSTDKYNEYQRANRKLFRYSPKPKAPPTEEALAIRAEAHRRWMDV